MPPQVLARELAHRDGRDTTTPPRAKHSLGCIEKQGGPPLCNSYGSVSISHSCKYAQMGTCVPVASCVWSEQESLIPLKGDCNMRSHKKHKALRDLLRSLRANGRLKPERLENFAKAIVKLEHELKVGSQHTVFKAVDDLARLFLRDVD